MPFANILDVTTESDNCGVTTVAHLGDSAMIGSNPGVITRTYSVTDPAGNNINIIQLITVNDTTAPTITAPGNTVGTTNVGCTSTNVALGSPVVSDNCTSTGSLLITNNAPSPFPLGSTTVTWTVEDAAGNTATATQVVIVTDNINPTASNPTPSSYQCIADIPLANTNIITDESDNCSSPTVTLFNEINNGGVGSSASPYIVTRTYRVTDAAGNFIDTTHTITVIDNTDPVILFPNNQNVNFDANCEYVLQDYRNMASTSDNCDTNVSITQSPIAGTTQNSAITVTLTATDDAGNTDTISFNVTPSDVSAPTALARDFTATLSVNGTVNISALDLDNGSTDNCGIANMTVSPSSFNCDDIGSNTVTFTVYDDAGYSDSTTATVTVVDTTAPTMLCNDYVVVVDAITRVATIQASDVDNGSNDACGLASLTVSPSVFPEDVNGNVYTTTTTLTAEDVNGNINTCVVTITVEPPKNQFTYLTGLITPLNGDTASPLIEATSCPGGANTPRDVQFTLQAIGSYVLQASDVNYWEYSNDNGENWIQINGTAGILTHTITGITSDRFVRLNITDNYTDPMNPVTKTSAEAYVRFLPPDEPPIVVSQSAIDICLGADVTIVAESFFDQPNGQFGDGGEFNYAQPDGWRVDYTDGFFPASGNNTTEPTWKEANSNNNREFSGINYDTDDNTKFAMANGVGNNTTLETPVFSTIGMTSAEAILTFDTSYYFCNGGYGQIFISFDSGNTYLPQNELFPVEPIFDFDSRTGGTKTTGVELTTGSGNKCLGTTKTDPNTPRLSTASINLGAYSGLSGLRIMFVFNGSTTDCGIVDDTTFPDNVGNDGNCRSNNSPNVLASGWLIDNVGFAYAQVDDELEWTDEDGNVIQVGTTATVLPITPGIREYGVTTLVNGCRTDNDSGTNFVNINASLAYAGQDYTPLASECGESALQLNAYDNTISAVTNFNKGAWVNNLYVVPDTAAGETDYAPTGVTGTWSVVNSSSTSCGNSAVFSSNTDPDAIFTADPGNYTLRWTLNDGSNCSDDIEVTLTDCNTVDFDGTNDYVTFKNNYNIDNDFSIEVWVKPNSISNTSTVFSRKDFGNNSNGYDLSIVNGQVRFNWYYGSGSGTITSGAYNIGIDRWYHLAVTFNGSVYKLYIDGLELGSVNNSNAPTASANNIEALLGAMDQSGSNVPTNYFHGWIDELKIWNKGLNVEHIRQMMNQEIEALGSDVGGVVIPLKIYGVDTNADNVEEDVLIWANLDGYYRMDVVCGDLDPYKGVAGRLRNITSSEQQTAPLPYTTRISNQNWNTASTWTHHDVWDPPNSTGINGGSIDWNIAQTTHDVNINSGTPGITVLGLLVEAGSNVIVADPTITNPVEENSGKMLWVSQYLKLNGLIDLVGESQLIQKAYSVNQYYESILDPTSSGSIEKDQQGIMNSYSYNYWSPPVSRINNTINNSPVYIGEILYDGTNSSNPQPITFGGNSAYYFADVTPSSPGLRVASAWIWKYVNRPNAYAQWEFLGDDDGTINPSEGYTMKGVDVNGTLDLNSAHQNYVYIGKPNNVPAGPVGEPIVHTTFSVPADSNFPNVSLAGNPFPSALDADTFILDNSSTTDETLYFWEHWSNGTHEWALYQGGYAIYKRISGGVPAVTHAHISSGGAARSTPGRYVPVGQGFYVISSAAGGDVVFKNNQREYATEIENGGSSSVFIKNGSNTKKENGTSHSSITKSEDVMRIRLGFESPDGYHRQVMAAFFKEATDGFDQSFDAVAGDYLPNDAFFIQDDKYYVIQAFGDFNEDREIPISVFIDEDQSGGIQKFMIDELENIPEDVEIYIKDNYNDGETYNIREGSGFEISLESGEHKDRFSLVFQSRLSRLDELAKIEDGVTIFMNNSDREIVIQKTAELDFKKVVLYNYIGQKMMEWEKGLGERDIRLPVKQLSTGVYIVNLECEQGLISKKVLIE